jgi:hypothetical protein
MANYTVTDYVTSEDRIEVVMAAMETKLEALDSTSNPIRQIQIIPLPNGKFIGSIQYD